jgi:hypothetical protein
MFLAPQVLALSYLKEAVVLVNEIFFGLGIARRRYGECM